MSKIYESMTAVGYCRVSTDDKGQTNETQRRAIMEWSRRTGAEIIEIYEDEMTGTTLSRPGLMQAIGRILCDGVKLFVAYDQSRFTRNEDLPKIKEMIGHNCSIRYVTSDIDPESLGGRVTDAVRQIFDKEENLIRSAKTRGGMATRRDVMNVHVGRPAKVVFLEELEICKKGLSTSVDDRHKTQTLVYPISVILEMADKGRSLNYTATKILNVTAMSLRRALSRPALVDHLGFNPLMEYKKRYKNAKEQWVSCSNGELRRVNDD